jgi:hypothetical protein
MIEEPRSREAICKAGLSHFSRSLTFGSTGHIAVGLPDGGWLMAPTYTSLGKTGRSRSAKQNHWCPGKFCHTRGFPAKSRR